MTELEKLSILPVNKTFVFYSPIEGESTLVRTGTIGDGSCFFHALLHAYSKEYIKMNITERKKFVHRLRENMAIKVSKNDWQDIGSGLIAKIPFQENVNDILLNFYKFITNDKTFNSKIIKKLVEKIINNDNTKLEIYKLLIELIPFENGFEKNILPDSYNQCQDDKVDTCKKEIINNTLAYLNNLDIFKQVSKPQASYISESITNFITTVVNEAENSAYNNYIKSLQTVSEYVDSYTIGLISDKFNRDIYFIDSTNRMPYMTADSYNLKSRKSIILLWTGGVHYEIVGRLLPGNKVQREFNIDDILIKKLNTFILKPQSISQKYPELIPYLPKEYRKNISRHSNRSYYSSHSPSPARSDYNSEINESDEDNSDEDNSDEDESDEDNSDEDESDENNSDEDESDEDKFDKNNSDKDSNEDSD